MHDRLSKQLVQFVAAGSLLISACISSNQSLPMAKDRFVEFRSEIGNSLVAPSNWTADDQGNAWYVRSPDGHAVISVLTFTAEGSGSLEDFGNLIAARTLPDGETACQESSWSLIALKQATARMRKLIPISGNSKLHWRVYVIHTGRMYHAIVLSASESAMALNGDFYESIVQTVEGIE